jgi:hypothetical protein
MLSIAALCTGVEGEVVDIEARRKAGKAIHDGSG